MHSRTLEADYLVIGSGAMGMAFTDALVAESSRTVVLIDRHHRPGGHWNDAYSFVRLHQPSAFYGVNSLLLGGESIDRSGLNEGLYELATGTEICGYFDEVLERQLLPTRRVQYFPCCDYVGDRRFMSLTSGMTYEVNVRRAVVDATYTKTEVPSTRKPPFAIAGGVRCIPVNDLTSVKEQPSAYVVVGAGKTAIDACLYLLESGVSPNDIRWIKPRESWLVNRVHLQPGALFDKTLEGLALQMEAAANAETVADLFERLNASEQMLRVDEDVWPTMYRCSTVTKAEIARLRRIRQVIRLGRVRRIERDRVVLQDGSVPSDPACLYVDCTASGVSKRKKVPVFGADTITLQAVRTCQPAFSAALIGHVEANYEDSTTKNALCSAIPYPETEVDWVRMTVAGMMNEHAWRQDGGLRRWIESSRLNGYRAMARKDGMNAEMLGFVQRFRESAGPAMMNLGRLLAEAEARAA